MANFTKLYLTDLKGSFTKTKAPNLELTFWCPLNSDRRWLDLLRFFPSTLLSGLPCCYRTWIRAHVCVSSLKHSQNEDVRLSPGHCYVPTVQPLLVLTVCNQRSLFIQGGYSDFLLRYISRRVCRVRPGHAQAAILEVEEVDHLTAQFSGLACGLRVQKGCKGHLELQICERRRERKDNQSQTARHKQLAKKYLPASFMRFQMYSPTHWSAKQTVPTQTHITVQQSK